MFAFDDVLSLADASPKKRKTIVRQNFNDNEITDQNRTSKRSSSRVKLYKRLSYSLSNAPL